MDLEEDDDDCELSNIIPPLLKGKGRAKASMKRKCLEEESDGSDEFSNIESLAVVDPEREELESRMSDGEPAEPKATSTTVQTKRRGPPKAKAKATDATARIISEAEKKKKDADSSDDAETRALKKELAKSRMQAEIAKNRALISKRAKAAESDSESLSENEKDDESEEDNNSVKVVKNKKKKRKVQEQASDSESNDREEEALTVEKMVAEPNGSWCARFLNSNGNVNVAKIKKHRQILVDTFRQTRKSWEQVWFSELSDDELAIHIATNGDSKLLIGGEASIKGVSQELKEAWANRSKEYCEQIISPLWGSQISDELLKGGISSWAKAHKAYKAILHMKAQSTMSRKLLRLATLPKELSTFYQEKHGFRHATTTFVVSVLIAASVGGGVISRQ